MSQGYFELYQQALTAIDEQGIPDWSKDYYPAVRKLHKELVDLHKPTDIPIWSDGDWDGRMNTKYEDRETRIASGAESWTPGGAL